MYEGGREKKKGKGKGQKSELEEKGKGRRERKGEREKGEGQFSHGFDVDWVDFGCVLHRNTRLLAFSFPLFSLLLLSYFSPLPSLSFFSFLPFSYVSSCK
jgi:hypothetical protein